MSNAEKQKVTIYFQGSYGLNKVEGRLLTYGKTGERGYQVTYIPKGGRRRRMLSSIYVSNLVIAKGWGLAATPSAFHAPEESGAVSVSRGKYSSCSPEWANDLAPVVASLELVADFR